jgi:hypothetical protein
MTTIQTTVKNEAEFLALYFEYVFNKPLFKVGLITENKEENRRHFTAFSEVGQVKISLNK